MGASTRSGFEYRLDGVYHRQVLMRRLLSIFACFVAFSLAGSAAASAPSPHAIEIPKWFSESFLDFREDVRDATREGKRVMVYFGQDGCPYCKALMTVNFRDPAIVET